MKLAPALLRSGYIFYCQCFFKCFFQFQSIEIYMNSNRIKKNSARTQSKTYSEYKKIRLLINNMHVRAESCCLTNKPHTNATRHYATAANVVVVVVVCLYSTNKIYDL